MHTRLLLVAISAISSALLDQSAMAQQFELAPLPSPNPQSGDLYGWSAVRIGEGARDLIVGGAAWSDSEAAYAFRQSDRGWALEENFEPWDTVESINFGFHVGAACGGGAERVVVGAPRGLNDSGKETGAVYVFRRDDVEGWQQEQKLVPSDGKDGDEFGVRLELVTDGQSWLLVVGAYERGEPYGGGGTGAAYVFEWNGATWVEVAKLSAPEGEISVALGLRLAALVTPDVRLVLLMDSNPIVPTVVRCFEEVDGVWGQTQIIQSPRGERQGGLVSISVCEWKGVQWAAVGESSATLNLFRRDLQDGWVFDRDFVFEGMQSWPRVSLAADSTGMVCLLGWPFDSEQQANGGSVMILRNAGDGWLGPHPLFPPRPVNDGQFGLATGLTGGAKYIRAVVGADRWIEGRGRQIGSLFAIDEIDLCAADLDDDGLVTSADLAQLLAAWGECGESSCADLTNDGHVGADDFAVLLAYWGVCPVE